MPYSLADAPPNIPDAELIESLLCERIKRKQARPLQELTEAERAQTNLVELGKRQTHIDGDPYGVWCAWAGNVCHQEDDRMVRMTQNISCSTSANTDRHLGRCSGPYSGRDHSCSNARHRRCRQTLSASRPHPKHRYLPPRSRAIRGTSAHLRPQRPYTSQRHVQICIKKRPPRPVP